MRRWVVMLVIGVAACAPISGRGAGSVAVAYTPAPSPVVLPSPSPEPSAGSPQPVIEYQEVGKYGCFPPNSPSLPANLPHCQTDPDKNWWVPAKPTTPICVIWDGHSGPLPSPEVHCQPPG